MPVKGETRLVLGNWERGKSRSACASEQEQYIERKWENIGKEHEPSLVAFDNSIRSAGPGNPASA
jgi:hypothetical protein